MKEIPVIVYGVNEESGDSFNEVANTKNPAIKSKGYMFSDEEKEVLRNKFFSDDEKMILIAPVAIPNVDMKPRWDWVDLGDGKGPQYLYHKPLFTEESCNQMYKKFMKDLKTSYIFNTEHTEHKAPGYMFEVWQKEDMVKDKSAKYGLDHPVGTVYMMEQVEDRDYWNYLKENGAHGFSIQGNLGTKRFSDDEEIEAILKSFSEEKLEALFQYVFACPPKGDGMRVDGTPDKRCVKVEESKSKTQKQSDKNKAEIKAREEKIARLKAERKKKEESKWRPISEEEKEDEDPWDPWLGRNRTEDEMN